MAPVEVALALLLIAIAVVITQLRDLFAAAMLFGVFSLLAAGLFVLMDAVDVAFTEAAVGAGISVVLLLGTLSLTAREERQQTFRWRPLLVVVATGAALVYGTLDMPAHGDPEAPIHHHVAPEYIEGARNDLHIPNVVTAVLASYRGYDTLGETVVIFTAGVGVLLLLAVPRHGQVLGGGGASATPDRLPQMLILRMVARMIVPLILLFGLYVQFHGDFGPGGGFQAGVIVSAALILFALVEGLEAQKLVVPPGLLEVLMAVGVLIFGGTGVVSMIRGGRYLDYDFLVGGQHLGIFVVELGVGITVAATMLKLFVSFAGYYRR